MSASGEGLGRILTVALGLCLVCSMVVSTAAVVLKPAQQANKTLDLKRNILMAAGLLDPALSVEEQFEQVETRVVNLDQGRFVEGVDPAQFDQREAAKDPARSRALAGAEDPAKRQDRLQLLSRHDLKLAGQGRPEDVEAPGQCGGPLQDAGAVRPGCYALVHDHQRPALGQPQV